METLNILVSDALSDRVHDMLRKASDHELQISSAESCTGGLLASLLTDVEGVSHVFERGFVTYSDGAKCDLLDIDPAQVEDCGAVSKEVALAMARGAISRSGADVAVSITGFAGPGKPEDEEGLVHFGCAWTGDNIAHREEHFGPIGRGPVRLAAIEVALDMIDDALDKLIEQKAVETSTS